MHFNSNHLMTLYFYALLFSFFFQLIVTVLAVTLLPSILSLAIEHPPQSYSLFKRGLVLGDVTYSYAATDMGSANGSRVKTVTVIKNMALPKATSTMFTDRTDQFFSSFDDVTGVGGGHGQSKSKQNEHVQYWPAKESNKMKKVTLQPPVFSGIGISSAAPEIKEHPQEEFKHPLELLEIAKSAARTQNQLMGTVAGEDTGPHMFPADATMSKKRNNGVVTVAKDYTSVVTTERSKPKTAGKLNTKVESTKSKDPPRDSFNSFDPSSLYQDEFEQSEYVYSPKKKEFTLKQTSKPSQSVGDRIRNTPFAFRDPAAPATYAEFALYNSNQTTPELLFSELANAVASRNISMIKNLAEQLDDQDRDVPKYEFESLKTNDEYVPLSKFSFGRKGLPKSFPIKSDGNKDNEYVPVSFKLESTGTKSNPVNDYPFDGEASYDQQPEPEVTTVEAEDSMMEISDTPTTSEPIMPSTTMGTTTTIEPAPVTTKKPLKYIAPRLRGFKRFSSRRQ